MAALSWSGEVFPTVQSMVVDSVPPYWIRATRSWSLRRWLMAWATRRANHMGMPSMEPEVSTRRIRTTGPSLCSNGSAGAAIPTRTRKYPSEP